MDCIITYNNKEYTQSEFNAYFKNHFYEFITDLLNSDKAIADMEKFVGNTNDKYEDNVSCFI